MDRTEAIRCWGAAIAIVLNATMPMTDAAEDLVPFEGLKEQFSIALPGGWSVYDQSDALSGEQGPFGVVFFSAQPLTIPGEKTADMELLSKADVREIPSFLQIDNLLERAWRAASFQDGRQGGLRGWPGTIPQFRTDGSYRGNSFRNELNLAGVMASK